MKQFCFTLYLTLNPINLDCCLLKGENTNKITTYITTIWIEVISYKLERHEISVPVGPFSTEQLNNIHPFSVCTLSTGQVWK